MSMLDFNNTLRSHSDMKAYFDLLPAFIQENIYRTSSNIANIEQLKRIVSTMTDRQG